MNKIGLVLAGGGAKGAYHIGVWKALNEFGVTENVTAVSGTSVGALNALLFAQGNYEIAEYIWKNISHEQILSQNETEELNKFYNLAIIANETAKSSIFSRKGMVQILNKSVDWNYIDNGAIDCYAACLKIMDESFLEGLFHFADKITESIPILGPIISGGSKLAFGKMIDSCVVEYFKLSNYPNEIKQSILLATSAIPIVFPDEKINDAYYIDGGIKDNIPIKPLYDDGYRKFIVVHLNRTSILDYNMFPGASIIEIIPQIHQGGLIDGTMDFDSSNAIKRIEQGYTDATRALKPLFEMGLTNSKYLMALKTLQQNEIDFKKEIAEKQDSLKNIHCQIDAIIDKIENLR